MAPRRDVPKAHYSRAIPQRAQDVQQDDEDRKSRLSRQKPRSSREVRCGENNDWEHHPVNLSVRSYKGHQSYGYYAPSESSALFLEEDSRCSSAGAKNRKNT